MSEVLSIVSTIKFVDTILQDLAANLKMTLLDAYHATVWAHIQPLSAREFLQASAVNSEVVARVQIRYLAGVMPSMRLVHGTHVYNIKGVLPDPVSGLEYLTLPVSEVVNG